MLLSSFIEELTLLGEKHGDLEVFVVTDEEKENYLGKAVGGIFVKPEEGVIMLLPHEMLCATCSNEELQ